MITPQVKESVFRLMTRLAIQHKAINLLQGFPNEPPLAKLQLALAHAVLSGNVCSDDEASRLSHTTANDLSASIVNLLTRSASNTPSETSTDKLNQYLPPMGRADTRQAVSLIHGDLLTNFFGCEEKSKEVLEAVDDYIWVMLD
jgi:hypothetical protein